MTVKLVPLMTREGAATLVPEGGTGLDAGGADAKYGVNMEGELDRCGRP